MGRIIALVMLVAVLTSGCNWIGLSGKPPAWVTDREPLPSCGVEDLGHGEGVDTQARRCLLDAFHPARRRS